MTENEERADRGIRVVTDYGSHYGEDEIESTLLDILADLMHAYENNPNYAEGTFSGALTMARLNYDAERTEAVNA